MDAKRKLIIDATGDYMGAAMHPDRCINSTWVMLHVFKHFEIASRGMAVDLICGNTAWASDVQRAGRIPRDGECGPDAQKVITDSNGVGHLVALVDNTVVDLAVDQFSRPAWGIVLPKSIHFGVKPTWSRGNEMHCFPHNGVLVAYSARPTDRRFEQRAGFQADLRNETMVRDVLELIQARLKALGAHDK